eukprot:CAMPEP_0198326334 /NCGR_PEP_ID=MMETSP1450-20131203/13885_1 /TAXON_ID=753684 ORGANISM="Madagascaria erythrocladiodes, Strain CCMP3234" /NCGR_SAMPLE_ID=MMETSP1450 /ASSEMBLY_ACC=CAM_ASM_001115 /LENGTH=299 /DNA_ID=CAMNT_0044030291 /DNA_START=1 /DNA_END=900 /DNA_ORIENTATION=-
MEPVEEAEEMPDEEDEKMDVEEPELEEKAPGDGEVINVSGVDELMSPEKRSRKKSAARAASPGRRASADIPIVRGVGVALGTIPNIAYRLESCKNKDQQIVALHRLLFNAMGKEHFRKKHIKDFNGFPENYPPTRLKERITKLPIATVRGMAGLLDVDTKATKEGMADGMVKLLMKPCVDETRKNLRAEAKKEKKRKADEKSGKVKKKPKKQKEDSGFVEEYVPKIVIVKTDAEIREKVVSVLESSDLDDLSFNKIRQKLEREWRTTLTGRMELIRETVKRWMEDSESEADNIVPNGSA